MPINYVGGATEDAGFTTDLTLVLPTHETDDVGIAICGISNDPNSWAENTAGWTRFRFDLSTAGFDMETALFYRVFTSDSETDPVFELEPTAVAGGHAASLTIFRGVDTTNPFATTTGTPDSTDASYQEQINNDDPAAPDITPDVANSAIITMLYGSTSQITTAGSPTGYTEAVAARNLDTGNQITVSYLLDAGAAELESPGSFNHTGMGTGDDSVTYAVALRAAGGSGRIMGSLANQGGLAGMGGIAGSGGGLV